MSHDCGHIWAAPLALINVPMAHMQPGRFPVLGTSSGIRRETVLIYVEAMSSRHTHSQGQRAMTMLSLLPPLL